MLIHLIVEIPDSVSLQGKLYHITSVIKEFLASFSFRYDITKLESNGFCRLDTNFIFNIELHISERTH